jgi:hypothetical protein
VNNITPPTRSAHTFGYNGVDLSTSYMAFGYDNDGLLECAGSMTLMRNGNRCRRGRRQES